MGEGFDVAQIRPNGHVANPFATDMPKFNQKFCEE